MKNEIYVAWFSLAGRETASSLQMLLFYGKVEMSGHYVMKQEQDDTSHRLLLFSFSLNVIVGNGR